MKKHIFFSLAALLTLSVGAACAQDGLSIGAGYRRYCKPFVIEEGNALVGMHPESSGPLNGFFVGVDYVSEELLGPLDLGFGLNFGGAWTTYRDKVTNEGKRFRSLDLEIPVFLRWGIELGHVKPYIFAGPTIFLGLSMKDGLGRGDDSNMYSDYNGIYKMQYRRFDCLVGGGVGVILNDKIRIQAALDYGLINRLKKYEYSNSSFSKVNNLQLNVGVAYCFN